MSFTRVRDKETRHEYTVGVVNDGAHEVLDDEPAVDAAGVPLPPRYYVEPDPDLKGQALTQALRDAGLSTEGTADDKRQRLADYQAEHGTNTPEETP